MRVQRIAVLTLLLFATASLFAAAPAVPPLWLDLKPGNYKVGFETMNVKGDGKQLHPLPLRVWYPASKDDGKAMTFRDYILVDQNDTAGLENALKAAGVSPKTTSDLLTAPVFARQGAKAVQRPFHVVLVAQGNGHLTADQAVLAEYIASYGFVVVTMPSITYFKGETKSDADVAARAKEQAADIDRAALALQVDETRDVTVIGHSFGARAALYYAALFRSAGSRTTMVQGTVNTSVQSTQPLRAVISLDGGIGTATAPSSMDSIREARYTAPILHLYETTEDFMKPDFTFLRALRSPRLFLEEVPGLRHTHFTSMGFASALFPEIAKATKAPQDVTQQVSAVASRVLQFIRFTPK